MSGKHAAAVPTDAPATVADVRVVSGDPSAEELAAVVAVLQRQADEAAALGRAEVTVSPRAGWDASGAPRSPSPRAPGGTPRPPVCGSRCRTATGRGRGPCAEHHRPDHPQTPAVHRRGSCADGGIRATMYPCPSPDTRTRTPRCAGQVGTVSRPVCPQTGGTQPRQGPSWANLSPIMTTDTTLGDGHTSACSVSFYEEHRRSVAD
ncbi:acyl-CoA carboxylase epsilon subunit [Curtobacterium flaccumfaciens]|uniref:acyl-CoA carboxylase epsilon subunit n=1 Tax=Curtobacterium flaccumfaciens TaxID=2035 RepID=UPI00349FCD18